MKPLALTFRFDQLPAEGRPLMGEVPEAELGVAVKGLIGTLGYRAEGPLTVEGRATPVQRDAVINASFRATVGFDCVRCLSARTLTVEHTVQHVLVRRAPASPVPEGEVELDPDALDEPDDHAFDGETVELAEIFREDLLLELPMNPSCDDAGVESCALPQAVVEVDDVDPRWAPLLAIKAKLGEGS